MTGIDSAEKVLFTSRYPEEKKTINRLKAEYLFCEKLCEYLSSLCKWLNVTFHNLVIAQCIFCIEKQ